MKKYIINEIEYDNLEDYIHIGLLGFCGCGCPEDSLEFVYNGLNLIKKLHDDKVRENNNVWEEFYKKWEKEKELLLGKGEYFLFYFFDKEGFTEHGGSVPGWLRDEGKELLEMLKEWRGE